MGKSKKFHKNKVVSGTQKHQVKSDISNGNIFTIRNFLIALLVIRFVSGVFYSVVPVHGLHIWRQTDVLSVAYSYYLRYFVEGNFSHFFLPSILNTDNGEFSIVRMEFPLVNFIISPAFVFGPYWGKVIANLMILFINYGLVLFNYRLLRNIKICSVNAGLAVLLLPNFSFTAIWTTRVMPDVISMLLTLTAVSLSWNKERPVLSFIFASLGLLVKPTSIVVLLLNLLKQNTFIKTLKTKSIIYDLMWGIGSVIVALTYYFIVIRYIGTFEVHNHFNVAIKNPIEQLESFFGSDDPMSLDYLFSVRLLCPPYIAWLIPGVISIQMMLMPYLGLFILLFGAFLFLICYRYIIAWRAIVIFVVQLLMIAALDGEHSFVHFYYYVGTTFAFAIVFIGYLTNIWKWCKPFLILILLLQFADIINFEIGDYFTGHFQWNPQSRVAFYNECSALKKSHPELPWHSGYVFNGPQLDNEQAAGLGICFGERERLHGANYGFYYKWDQMPENCYVIDNTEHINLAVCKN
ncbi:MAG: hypothetical protein ACK5Z5_05435 [Neisseriaceae bacterium]